MPAPTDPGDFTAGTTAAAAAVNTRFQRLYAALAADAIDAGMIATGAIGSAELATAAKQLFPQLVTAGDHKVAFGKTTLTFASSTNPSSEPTITHGLGATPAAVFVTIAQAATGYVFSVGGTTFVLSAKAHAALNATYDAYWLAIS